MVEIGAVLIGTPSSIKPTFLSGNRVIYNSSTSGTPGNGYAYAYKYEFTEISHRRNGRLFKIEGLG